jgi:hypothetical protein
MVEQRIKIPEGGEFCQKCGPHMTCSCKVETPSAPEKIDLNGDLTPAQMDKILSSAPDTQPVETPSAPEKIDLNGDLTPAQMDKILSSD